LRAATRIEQVRYRFLFRAEHLASMGKIAHHSVSVLA